MVSHQQIVLEYFVLQYPLLARPSQYKQAQQTNTHFCSGVWFFINRGVSYLRPRRCGDRDWEMIVVLLNCNPEMLSGKCFQFIIYFIERGVICKLEISTQVWGVPWIMRAVSRWLADQYAVGLYKTPVRVRADSHYISLFMSLKEAFFSSSTNINAIAANCLLENEWGCISDGDKRGPPNTCYAGRWLNMTDSVKTDQSDGMERERWQNRNVTYSVNQPLGSQSPPFTVRMCVQSQACPR